MWPLLTKCRRWLLPKWRPVRADWSSARIVCSNNADHCTTAANNEKETSHFHTWGGNVLSSYDSTLYNSTLQYCFVGRGITAGLKRRVCSVDRSVSRHEEGFDWAQLPSTLLELSWCTRQSTTQQTSPSGNLSQHQGRTSSLGGNNCQGYVIWQCLVFFL